MEALARLRHIVGADHVRTDSDVLARYSRDTIPGQRTCAAVVWPGSSQEVAEVVRVAARFRLPVWPFSKGRNWGYGGTMAAHDGAIILMLERLNRILEVNEELAYAVIEPGVTQRQLNNHLKEHGVKLWADCTDSTPEGSVLGNALERGLGYTPYGDHFGHLCGLEVVLPNGETIRTGGAPAHAPTWHTYKWGTGPYVEGLFSQSNLGVVIKAGIWLMPEPESFNGYFLDVHCDRDLPELIDAVRQLALQNVVHSNVHLVNDFLFLTLLTQYPRDRLGGQSYLSDEARAALRRKFGIAPWTLVGGLYGPRAQVRANRSLLERALARYGRLTFLDDRRLDRLRRLTHWCRRTQSIPGIGWLSRRIKNWLLSPAPLEVMEAVPHVYDILKGIPGEFIVSCAYAKCRRGRPRTDIHPARDGCGLMWFAPVVPLTGTHANRVLQLCQPLFARHGFDFSASFIMVNPRSAVALLEILYDKNNLAEERHAQNLYEELTEAMLRLGYPQYRTSVAYMDRILDGNTGCQELADTIKAALDPDHILAPGRYGVGVSRQ
jgi:4-cresol dehydrogenase (hydroxylating)